MKKILLISICIMFIFCLIGCKEEKETILFGQSDNEIFTYERIDYSKTQIVVSKVGDIRFDNNVKEFEEKNPDIQIIYTDITGGGNGCKPWIEYLKNGDLPDVLLSVDYDSQIGPVYFEDLSIKEYTKEYYISSLDDYNENGKVYGLPGPSELVAIAYNKTLFEQHNWLVPNTFEEFVNLCIKITEETKDPLTGIPLVEAYNPNGKYVVEFMAGMVAFAYSQVIAGSNNRDWYNNFINGKNATFSGHMEPFYEMINKLIENNIIRQEHWTYGATKRGVEFTNGNIAMINVSTNKKFESEEYEFGWFAFPGLNSEENYIDSAKSFVMSVVKKNRTEKEKEAVDRFITYMSTEDGQETYTSGKLLVSNLKNVKSNTVKFDSHFKDVIENGRVYNAIQFASGSYITDEYEGYPNEIMFSQIKAMVANGQTRNPSELTAEFDQKLTSSIGKAKPKEYEIVAKVTEDFTILETSNLIADVFKNKAETEIALVLNNAVYRGNVAKYYKGDITMPAINYTTFRSLDNNSTLMKADVTGEQLMNILNNPYSGMKNVEEVYAFSGLKATINPWNEQGNKILSVTLTDGTTIDLNKIYSISYWDGTVNPEYITSIPVKIEGTFLTILAERFKELQNLTPARDGRITLVWE